MGILPPIPSTESGLARALFPRVQLRVLGLLFAHPDQEFSASEIIRLAASGSGAVQRELKKLTSAGILTMVRAANRKLYRANRSSPIYDELHGLIAKTVGLAGPLREALEQFRSKIELAFVYGSVAKGEDTAGSDIDLMIIGSDIAYGEIFAALQGAERILRRPVNPNLMTPDEWQRKRAQRNAFVARVLHQPKLFLFGSESDLGGAR